MDEQADAILVGEWVARRRSGELISEGRTERLEPKAMDLLFLLASMPGEAFSKDAIMERVWPGVVVGEDTLARAVSRLRKALGDDAKTPRYIETLHKRGYRLIADVGAAEAAPKTARAFAPARKPALRWSAIGAVASVVAIVIVAGLRLADVPSAAAGPRVLTE